MSYREAVLELAGRRPVLPVEVAKLVNKSSLFAGAMLSEMVSKGLLKVSSVKVGGSPVYFIPGNEAQLLDFRKFLDEKTRRALASLESGGVLRDSDLSSLDRVCFRSAKDFALPLQVSYDGKQELFWKWFLLSDSDAESGIRSLLSSFNKGVARSVKKKPSGVESKGGSGMSSVKGGKRDDSWLVFEDFFRRQGIVVVEKTLVRKGEFDLVVEVPTPVGALNFFCKAKSKKRVSDSDLSAAYVAAELRKLPVLYVTTGELTKKAKDVLSRLSALKFMRVKDGG